MNNRNRLITLAIILVVVLGIATFPLWRPLFVDDVVSEAFPGMSPQVRESFDALPQAQQDAFVAMSEEDSSMAMTMVDAALSPDAMVDDAMPDMPTAPTVLAVGSFIEIDAVHRGEGEATLYQLEDGRQLLRLENFRVTNGPDLHVILSRAEAPISHEDVGDDYVDLGSLKGNVGEQNYDIPAGLDLSEYRSVVIYCVPFHVVFSTATLEQM